MKPKSPTSDASADARVDVTLAAPAPGFDEETARSELYGLLALVYYAPPAIEFIASLRVAVTDAPAQGGHLEAPWQALVAVARDMPDAAIHAEFDALFGGVGKPDIYLFGSHYLSGFLNEKPLAALRHDLAALGLARSEERRVGKECRSRWSPEQYKMIAGDDVSVANLTQQMAFFSTHLQPWTGRLCDALVAHPKARFYAAVAELTRAFVNVEAQGFDMVS